MYNSPDMAGILGGLLEVIHLLGGYIFFLLIGRRAWSETTLGRSIRLTIGGSLLGVFVGVAFVFIWPYVPAKVVNGATVSESTGLLPAQALFLGLGLTILVTWGLEAIRLAIEESNGEL